MNSMDIMPIFDAIVLFMGLKILVTAIRGRKTNEVDPLFVPTQDMVHCRDRIGFSKYLMPKCIFLGAFCEVFAALMLINDFVYDFGRIVNAVLLISFLVVFFWFTYALRKGRKEFLH